MPEKTIEDAAVLAHEAYAGAYRILTLRAPGIAPRVRPGQFVHAQLPAPADAILRRPFSVFQAEADGTLRILYKPVGRGTAAMLRLKPGDTLSLIGPLGRGFPVEEQPTDALPVLVAGGYGMAALYLAARALRPAGMAFFGGATAADILCEPDFTALGWDVRAATVDGSRGEPGLVTAALDRWLANERADRVPVFYVCGPNGMLRAVGERAQAGGWKAWLSLDRNMGCGVGACLTCVQKIRRDAADDWEWARCCKEGPVFECRQVVWDASDR